MTAVTTKVDRLFSDTARKQLIELRHDLHRNPELSFHEERTAERL